MKRSFWGLACLGSLALWAVPTSAQSPDPFLHLEEIESPSSLAWVATENARTANRLESDGRYQVFYAQARAIFTGSDRIPWPDFRAGGVDNFWQDGTHIHGVWRHTSLTSFRSRSPEWETLLDLDDLSKAEGRNWIWKGAICRQPDETVCLVRLSDGGSDAVEIREFDTRTKHFVTGGFTAPAGKQSNDWLDADTLIAARAWTPNDLSASGYPLVVKTVTRAGVTTNLFSAQKSDIGASFSVLHSSRGRTDGLVLRREVAYFKTEFYLLRAGKQVRIPLPLKSQYDGYVNGRLIFTLKDDWQGVAAGSVIAYKLADLGPVPEVVFTPDPQQAIQSVDVTAGKVVINLLDNVKGRILIFDLARGQWVGDTLNLPKDSSFQIRALSETDDRIFVSAEGFLDPPSLWLADGATGETEKIKDRPPQFEASKHQVEQYWATSSDGMKIPYFIVRPKAAKLDGSTPTLMYGYGGFELSKPPVYLPEMGKIWLENGGAYVIANIRGGGEFGPAWHEAALREKRQLAFDDFAAVAKDMSARGLTSPRRLGIYGRSNGGVLTTVSMTQHPELWTAVVVESPLVDMLRYHKLSAGSSWIAEYGDPDVPGDAAFIGAYSAYQNLKPGVKYPEAYITTNTRDDRVHPGHARKFAAKLQALGVPYLYYEQTFGGHANDADPELNARRWARHYVYLAEKLMD
ncbi:MAG: S9 family peptidase [Phenylobacterium zucineum]|nr:MAG: S9 family peptidase [Phenylobacterium zucineum]